MFDFLSAHEQVLLYLCIAWILAAGASCLPVPQRLMGNRLYGVFYNLAQIAFARLDRFGVRWYSVRIYRVRDRQAPMSIDEKKFLRP